MKMSDGVEFSVVILLCVFSVIGFIALAILFDVIVALAMQGLVTRIFNALFKLFSGW